ncbi:hypothetical protein [Clostridium gasigenes]|uniref:Uncharacterized protein n=1 Tax=Clostridium gasigenes TaxID=94869 RepID=A0A7X0SEX0_9CLOT|nr:hypothetical protein [Clostridium gasigenes]MBB6716338.1 hypothetical protein [Clostridium gasigenes]
MGRIALIYFKGATEHMEYSYETDIEGLKKDDPVVVPTNTSFSIGYFSRYSINKIHARNATKCIVQKVDIEAYEIKMFLGDM